MQRGEIIFTFFFHHATHHTRKPHVPDEYFCQLSVQQWG